MFYPEELIEEIRTKNDIVDVISSYVKLQKKGSSYFGLCPFHNEKSPSFSVSGAKQMYYCFGCGAGGNVFTFLMSYENLTFVETVKELADRAGVVLPETEMTQEEKAHLDKKKVLYEINKTAARYFCYQLTTDDGSQARNYLEERRLSRETLLHFGLGYASKFGDDLYRYLRKQGYSEMLLKESGLITFDEKKGAYDKFWNRVMFPIMDVNNRVIGFGGRVMGEGTPKYLNSPETQLFDKSRNLYGLNYAKISRRPFMIICEGYMDVIAMHQAGFTNAVASLGTAFTTQHSILLKRYTEEVRLAYDSDGAGVKAALRAILILRQAGLNVRVIHMEPYKDPDEFIKNLGHDAFEARIDEAESSFMFEIAVLERDYKQYDPQSRVAFLKATAGRLMQFPDAMERNVYVDAISNRYGIPAEEFRRMVNMMGASMDYQPPQEEEAPVIQRKKIKKDKNEGIHVAQRLLLTWLIDNSGLFDKIKGIVTEKDFTDPFYHQVASMVFEEFNTQGKVTPARIINAFPEPEEQNKAAAMFNMQLEVDEDEQLKEKALNETVIRIKRYSLDAAGKNARDLNELQQIVAEKAKLQKLHITL